MKSIYRLAERYGLYLGGVLTVMMFSMIGSVKIAALSLLAVGIFFFVPFLIFRWLRSSYRQSDLTFTFSALWMEGIMIFAYGCLLMGAAMFVFMKYIQPDFIISQLEMASEIYAQAGGSMTEVSDLIDKMIEAGNVPTPIEVCFQFIWLGIFTGSLMSMIVSLIVRKTTRRA